MGKSENETRVYTLAIKKKALFCSLKCALLKHSPPHALDKYVIANNLGINCIRKVSNQRVGRLSM